MNPLDGRSFHIRASRPSRAPDVSPAHGCPRADASTGSGVRGQDPPERAADRSYPACSEGTLLPLACTTRLRPLRLAS
jgi:hypothetical protein